MMTNTSKVENENYDSYYALLEKSERQVGIKTRVWRILDRLTQAGYYWAMKANKKAMCATKYSIAVSAAVRLSCYAAYAAEHLQCRLEED